MHICKYTIIYTYIHLYTYINIYTYILIFTYVYIQYNTYNIQYIIYNMHIYNLYTPATPTKTATLLPLPSDEEGTATIFWTTSLATSCAYMHKLSPLIPLPIWPSNTPNQVCQQTFARTLWATVLPSSELQIYLLQLTPSGTQTLFWDTNYTHLRRALIAASALAFSLSIPSSPIFSAQSHLNCSRNAPRLALGKLWNKSHTHTNWISTDFTSEILFDDSNHNQNNQNTIPGSPMLLLHPLTTTHLHSRLYTDPLSALSAPPSFLELNATSPQAPLPTLVPTLIPILVSTTCGVLTTYNKRVPYTIKESHIQ